MAQKDFYKTLGVAEAATPEDIKKAYRKLAKKYHPDATGGDKAKEAKFKEISEAYDTLSDPKKRGEYDQQRKSPFGAGGFSGFEGFGGGFSGFGGARGGRGGKRRADVSIDIDEFLRNSGFEGFGRTSSGSSPAGAGRRVQKGGDLQTSIELTLPEAALGVEKTIVLEPHDGARKLTLRIPAGVDDGETIRVPAQGRPGVRGGPAGDLLVQVHVLLHPTFRRRGADLEVDLPLRVDEAVLGVKADLQTLEGKVQVAIPPGTGSGQRLRLKGKGAADRKGGRGDLYAVVQITVPKSISPEARELIEKFAELTRNKQ